MTRTCLSIAILILTAGVALAGPNAGLVLTVHGDQEGAIGTHGDPCGLITVPDSCEETIPSAEPSATGIEWLLVLAAGPLPVAFNTITFGIGSYSTGECYIGFYGPCRADLNPLELPSSGWPGPNSGTAVSWSPNCLTGTLVAVYYFGVYVYAPGVVPLGDFYPGQQAAVVSCDQPPVEDPIVAFGTFGCGGAVGEQVCPNPPTQGACCLPNGTCILLQEDACTADGYLWLGGPCSPNPCPPPGACCTPNGECTILLEQECLDAGYEWIGGATCDPNPCPPGPSGACCFDVYCVMIPELECLKQGGVWFGGSCNNPNPCLPTATRRETWGRIKSLYR